MTDSPQDPPQPPQSSEPNEPNPATEPSQATQPGQTTQPGQATESDRISRLRARSAPVEPTQPVPSAAAPTTPVPSAEAPPPPVPSADAPTSPVPSADAPPPRFATSAPPPPPAAAARPEAPSAALPYETPAAVIPAAWPPAGRGGWSPDSPRIVVAVATAVLAVAATALAGLVTSHVSSVNSVESTRSEVVGAATSGVATVLSYDYRHLDSDFATAERLLTPRFRKQYDDTTAKGVKPLAAKYKAISSADVSAAGVVDASGSRAVVLVFVNQTVTNSQLTAPRLDRSRIDVTLVRSNGHWLIDKLTTL